MIVAFAAVSRMKLDVSLEALTDTGDPSGRALQSVLNNFRSAEQLLVLATLPDAPATDAPVDSAPLYAFADRLIADIQHNPVAAAQVIAIRAKPDSQSRAFFEQVVVPNGLLYLNDTDYSQFLARLSRDGMAEQFRRNEQLIAIPGPAASAAAKAVLRDPLRLHEFAESKFAAFGSRDAYLSPDGRSLLIRIDGAHPPGDIEFAKALTASVSAAIDRANTDHLQMDVSGAYAIAAYSATVIRGDSISSVVSSVVSLLALFALVFRAPIRLFTLAMVPVLLGILFGFAAYAVVRGVITPVTAVIAAALVEIGIDYSIHYLAYFDTIRRRGATSLEAAKETAETIGGSLLAAWATTAIGFFAIALSGARALRDFSLAGVLGLLGAFGCTVLLLPAALVLFGDRATAAARWDMMPMLRLINRHRTSCLGFCLLVVVLSAVSIAVNRSILSLESDLTVLHPRPNPPLEANDRILQRLQMSPSSILVHLHAENSEELIELSHDLSHRLESDSARSAGVAGVLSLASLLPDPRVAATRTGPDSAARAARVLADFDAVVAESSFSPEALSGYRTFLQTLLTVRPTPGIDTLNGYAELRDAFLPADHSSGQAIAMVRFNHGLDQRAQRDSALDAMDSMLADLPGATLTGMPVIGRGMEAAVQRDLPRLAIAAGAAICIYLLIYFRSVPDSAMALVPTLFSLVCVVLIMQLLGQKLNMVNMIAIPLLISIDVDYGIFLVNASHETKGELLDRFAPVAEAIVLCAFTTILGFGSIYFTSIPAIQSLGAIVIAGVFGSTTGSLMLVMPLLLRRGEKMR
jgi:predicted RND superfamily exporter protein